MNSRVSLLCCCSAFFANAQAAPSPWPQPGPVIRQLCFNLDSIIAGELNSISTLTRLKQDDVNVEQAVNSVLQAQEYIRSNFVDVINSILQREMSAQDRDAAQDLASRISNVYRQCDLWIRSFVNSKANKLSDTDYDSLENYCQKKPQSMYAEYCEVPDVAKCADQGTKIGTRAWLGLKVKGQVAVCQTLARDGVDALLAGKLIDNPVTTCDDAYNEAMSDYVTQQAEGLAGVCEEVWKQDMEAKRQEQARLAQEAEVKRQEQARLAQEAEVKRQEQARLAQEAEVKRQEQERLAQQVKKLLLEPEMVDIPAGSFNMGSPSDEPGRSADEGPVHRVHIKAFAMGKYEITNAQFRKFRADHNSGEYKGHSLNADNQPVVRVTWDDAVAYTQWLSQQTGKHYRLPSEAEWEYAARAGTTTARYWGNDPHQACQYANVHDQTSKRINTWEHHQCDDGHAVAAPVGQFQPNAFGLYDTIGNVWEWNQDKWHDSYSGASMDGSAWEAGDSNSHVLRGGSWGNRPVDCRSADRSYYDFSYFRYGFRVALSARAL